MKKQVVSRTLQGGIKTPKAKRRESMINAAKLWEQVKSTLGDDVLAAQCLAPFFPKQRKDLLHFIDLLLNEIYSKWSIKVAGTLLARITWDQVDGVLRSMVERKRRSEDILAVIHSILESRECNDFTTKALWRFFQEYAASLSGHVLSRHIIFILGILQLFYSSGIEFDDIVRQFCKLLLRLVMCQQFAAQRFVETFSRNVCWQNRTDAISAIASTLSPCSRATFLISVSEYVANRQMVHLLRQALTLILSDPIHGIQYNIETIIQDIAERLKHTIYWDELADLILDLISRLDIPKRRLQYLSKVVTSLPRSAEGRVCELVKAVIQNPRYSQQEYKEAAKGNSDERKEYTEENA